MIRVVIIFTVMLLGPFALFNLKVFNIFKTSPSFVGDRKSVFLFLFAQKELKFFLAFGIF